MIFFISHRPWRRLALAMILLTQAEVLELVEELRSMAVAHPTAKVRDALNQLADRYAARIRVRQVRAITEGVDTDHEMAV